MFISCSASGGAFPPDALLEHTSVGDPLALSFDSDGCLLPTSSLIPSESGVSSGVSHSLSSVKCSFSLKV